MAFAEDTSEASMPVIRKGLFWRVVLLVLYSAGVLYFGVSRTSLAPEVDVPNSDKYLHALVFGGLGVLALRVTKVWLPAWRPWLCAAVAVAFAAFWGGLLEVVQAQTTYRLAEWGDFVADVLGAVVLVLIAMALRLDRSLSGLR